MSAIEEARQRTRDGAWELRVELRKDEAQVTRNSTVWFRVPDSGIPPSFGFRVWSLSRAVESDEWRESFICNGIRLSAGQARDALAWVETFMAEGE